MSVTTDNFDFISESGRGQVEKGCSQTCEVAARDGRKPRPADESRKRLAYRGIRPAGVLAPEPGGEHRRGIPICGNVLTQFLRDWFRKWNNAADFSALTAAKIDDAFGEVYAIDCERADFGIVQRADAAKPDHHAPLPVGGAEEFGYLLCGERPPTGDSGVTDGLRRRRSEIPESGAREVLHAHGPAEHGANAADFGSDGGGRLACQFSPDGGEFVGANVFDERIGSDQPGESVETFRVAVETRLGHRPCGAGRQTGLAGVEESGQKGLHRHTVAAGHDRGSIGIDLPLDGSPSPLDLLRGCRFAGNEPGFPLVPSHPTVTMPGESANMFFCFAHGVHCGASLWESQYLRKLSANGRLCPSYR